MDIFVFEGKPQGKSTAPEEALKGILRTDGFIFTSS